jgi:WD40 repeat protein
VGGEDRPGRHLAGHRRSRHDSPVRIWDPHTGQHRHTLTGHTDEVSNVAIAPDGTWLATTSNDQTIRIWDPNTGQHRHTLTGHTKRVLSVAIAPDGTWLATTSNDQTIRIWDPNTGQHRHTLTGHTKRVLSVAIARTAPGWPPPASTRLCGSGSCLQGAVLCQSAPATRSALL